MYVCVFIYAYEINDERKNYNLMEPWLQRDVPLSERRRMPGEIGRHVPSLVNIVIISFPARSHEDPITTCQYIDRRPKFDNKVVIHIEGLKPYLGKLQSL